MIEAVVAAALHAIVVGALLSGLMCGIVALTVRAIHLDAAVRHALWTIAICATAIMPLGMIAASSLRAHAAPLATLDGVLPVATRAQAQPPGSAPRSADALFADLGSARGPASPDHGASPVAPLTVAPPDGRASFVAPIVKNVWPPRPSRNVAVAVGAIWLFGTGIGLAALALSLWRLAGLKRRSQPLNPVLGDQLPWLTDSAICRREISVRLSEEIETPVAVGFRRPVILIPTGLAPDGGLGAIETLVLHEHAHLRRYDDWTNLLQRAIERMFWFHPLIWALGRRIALEREIAADDAVVEATGRPDEYARSLWQLAREMRMSAHTVVAPGAFFTRKQISIRIEALLERRPVARGLRRIAAGAVSLTALGCTVAAAASAPAIVLPLPAPTSALVASSAGALAASPAGPKAASRSTAQAIPRAVKTQGMHVKADAARAALAASPACGCTRGSRTGSGSRSTSRFARGHDAFEGSIVASRDALPGAASSVSTALGARAMLDGQALAKARAAIAAITAHDTANYAHDTANYAHTAANYAHTAVNYAHTAANYAHTAANYAHAAAKYERRIRRRQVVNDRELTDSDLSGQDLSGRDLSGRDLRGRDFRGRAFTGTDLSGADLRGARLDGAQFIGADLSGARVDGASLTDAVMTGTTVEGVSLRSAKITGLRVTGTSLAGMDLRGLDMRSVLGACLSCNLEDANLRGSDMHGVQLIGMNLSGADLRGANLRGAVLNGSNLESADLSGADLRDASLTGCALGGAKLHHARTAGATFTGSNLSEDS
jgi:uncharacterized protein YjbI with pentapeptide repeats/beta-lactamase regulating signal transducer with metallopeptidase domain